MYVLLSVCLISAAVWPDLGLFVVSSYSGIPASCKIKWKMAHAHSKSEIAWPLCTVCVLRVPHCSKRALQQGGESGRTVLSVLCMGSAASPISPFSNFSVDALQVRCSMFWFPVVFFLTYLPCWPQRTTPHSTALMSMRQSCLITTRLLFLHM